MRFKGEFVSTLRRGRIAVALTAVGFAVFGLLGVDLYDSFKSSLERAKLQSSNLGLLLAERIVGTLNGTDFVLRDIAGRALPYIESGNVAIRRSELDHILSQKGSTLGQLSALILYDASGKLLACSDGHAEAEAANLTFFSSLADSSSLDSYTSRVFGPRAAAISSYGRWRSETRIEA